MRTGRERCSRLLCECQKQASCEPRSRLKVNRSCDAHGSGSDRCEWCGWWMLPAAGWTVHLPPASLFPSSLPPPPRPLLPFSVLRSTNRATPALLPTSPLSSSSLLHVYTLKGLTKLPGPTPITLTHTLPELLPQLPTKLSSSFSLFFPLFFFFVVSLHLFPSRSLSLLLLLSSCQVDISFISQEVFDRPFYEEMYPPAPQSPQHNCSNRSLSQHRLRFPLLTPQRPFHFTEHVFFVIQISSNVWSSTWKRDHLYILYLLSYFW